MEPLPIIALLVALANLLWVAFTRPAARQRRELRRDRREAYTYCRKAVWNLGSAVQRQRLGQKNLEAHILGLHHQAERWHNRCNALGIPSPLDEPFKD